GVGCRGRQAYTRNLQHAEGARLVDVDEAPLVELEYGQEADDDIEPFAVMPGNAAEGGVTRSGQLGHELVEGVAHAGPDGRHVVEVEARNGLRCERPHQRVGQVGRGDAGQDVGRHVDESLLE